MPSSSGNQGFENQPTNKPNNEIINLFCFYCDVCRRAYTNQAQDKDVHNLLYHYVTLNPAVAAVFRTQEPWNQQERKQTYSFYCEMCRAFRINELESKSAHTQVQHPQIANFWCHVCKKFIDGDEERTSHMSNHRQKNEI